MFARHLPFAVLCIGCASPAAAPLPAAVDAPTEIGRTDTRASPEVAPATADTAPSLPPAICRKAQPWSAGTKAFTDITDTVGVGTAGLAVAGIRLSTADVTGDDYPDLLVRRHVAGARDTFEAGKRLTWLLRNESGSGNWTFADATQKSGLLTTRDGSEGRTVHIAVLGDVDNDGDIDVFTGMNVAQDPKSDANKADSSELMLNDGKGGFALAPTQSFASSELRRSLNGASFTDYDRDGWLDLWLGYGTWGPNSTPIPDHLVQGNGKGGFQVVSAQEGVITKDWTKLPDIESGIAHRNTWGTAVCDVNGDGSADLLTTSYGRYFNGLWLGGGVMGGATRFGDAQAQTQFGRDDDDDWTTNWNAQCYCQENPSADECGKAPKPAINCPQLKAGFGGKYRWDHAYDRKPWRLGGNTGTSLCADFDRDGDLDLALFTIVHSDVGSSSDPTRIARNPGGPIPVFAHLKAKDTGLERTWPDKYNWNAGDMTGAALDFDADGRLDLLIASSDYPGTRAFLFRQTESGQFSEVPISDGIDHKHAHGVAVADFDRDGDLDVALGHSLARCNLSPNECQKTEQIHVFRNELSGNALELRLVGGQGTNRAGIGASVKITTGGVTQTAELGGGHGHYGLQHDLVLHFGLGAACEVDQIEVRWPDLALATQTWTKLRGNYLIELRQGEGAAKYVRPLGK
jgi:hypothetical protein